MKRKNTFFVLWNTAWLAITVTLGLMWQGIPGIYHPFWAVLTLPLVGLGQIKGWGVMPEIREKMTYKRERYGLLAGLMAAFLTGLGLQMGLFPLFLHQVIIWPLIAFFCWDLASWVRGKSED